MAEEPIAAKRTRNTKSTVLTFLFKTQAGELNLVTHKTDSVTKKLAWAESVEMHKFEGATMLGAFRGSVKWLEEKLRKPSYDELAKLAGLA